MKKTFLTCMAVVALFAIASSAGAITCTIDQRPAATLLIPYFQTTVNPDGSILSAGATATDTLVTIGNASSQPMLAHVAIWNDRTELVLDFNIALTGFDIQSWSMSSVLHGTLPVTPINQSHVSEVKDGHQVVQTGDVCQRIKHSGGTPIVYPATGGYLREDPPDAGTANTLDNTAATVAYPVPAFSGAFLLDVLDSLDATHDTRTCDGGTDGIITNPIHGYITIDHENYCTLANPNDAAYWTADAAGFENNLWGDYIYTSGAGIGTQGFAAVAIEATSSLDFGGHTATLTAPGSLADNTAVPLAPNITGPPGKRTFYRRYVHLADTVPCVNAMPAPQNAWDCGFGDQREPLGLKYAARWFDAGAAVTTHFNVWRASSGDYSDGVTHGLEDLLGLPAGKCNTSEPNVILTFYDEDENTVTTGTCPSPPVNCVPSLFNFPLETQRASISNFAHPTGTAGWVSMEFFNSGGPFGGTLDQAYVTYDFQGVGAFLSAGIPAAQLDPTNCQPLLVPCVSAGGPPLCYGPNPSANGVKTSTPVIPLVVGTGP